MKREKQRRSLSKNGDKRLEKDNFELDFSEIFKKLYSIYFLNFKKGLIQFLKLVVY